MKESLGDSVDIFFFNFFQRNYDHCCSSDKSLNLTKNIKTKIELKLKTVCYET